MSGADLKRFRLLSELEDDERLVLADEIETLDLDAGTRLFDEGEQGDALLLIAEGGVTIESTRLAGSALLGEGIGSSEHRRIGEATGKEQTTAHSLSNRGELRP